jgi:hypothetical protein
VSEFFDADMGAVRAVFITEPIETTASPCFYERETLSSLTASAAWSRFQPKEEPGRRP